MAVKKSTALIVLAVIVLLCLAFAFRAKVEMSDFEVNYIAGQRLRSGETLYRPADGHWQIKYLPLPPLPLPAADTSPSRPGQGRLVGSHRPGHRHDLLHFC